MTNLTSFNYPTAKELCTFLADYAEWLFSSGATCIRLEKNVSRMAGAFDMDVQVTILPRHIHLTVSDRSRTNITTSIATIHDRPISFDKNTQLSKLSWDVADGVLGFREATEQFRDIISVVPDNRWSLLILVSIANAAFCRLFGGDLAAMAIVFGATFAGFAIKQILTERHIDARITVIICAFVSSVLAAADSLFGVGETPAVTIGTSVLYLVPGIPFINSFCDVIDRHYICALGRMTNAVVITCCLSLGLCGGMMLMNVGMF